ALLIALVVLGVLGVGVAFGVLRKYPVEPIERAVPVLRRAPLPVVLVHGMFGFDRIPIPGIRLDYFRGIVAHLNQLGCDAHAVRLPTTASVPDRARALITAIHALPHDRIDMIAHSLGRLDP